LQRDSSLAQRYGKSGITSRPANSQPSSCHRASLPTPDGTEPPQ
jgi:hypothetical protein